MSKPTFRGLPQGGDTPRNTATVINRILAGKLNAVLEVTLAAGATTTVVTDPRLTGTSGLFFGGKTANYNSAPVLYYDTQDKGTVTLHHASNSNSDRTADMLIVG